MKPVLALVIGAIGIVTPLAVSSANAAGTCQTPWGSLEKVATSTVPAPTRMVNLRSGRHPCFDRLVVDLADGRAGYRVNYVDEVFEDGRGNKIPLRGGAFLDIHVMAPAHDDAGNATYNPADRSEAVSVKGYSTFRQVAWDGSFEGQSHLAIGVRARLPFRVFSLDGPGDGSRLVIDVAHRWYSQATTTVKVFYSTGDGSDCSEVTGYSRTTPATRAPVRRSLDQLLAGPTADEVAKGAGSFFSADTADSIRSINLDKGLLVVDFKDIRSKLNNASTSCGSAALLAQLNSTVFQFPAVTKVRYQINGSCDTFAQWLQGSCTDYQRR